MLSGEVTVVKTLRGRGGDRVVTVNSDLINSFAVPALFVERYRRPPIGGNKNETRHRLIILMGRFGEGR